VDFANPAASRRVYIDNITLGGRLTGYKELSVSRHGVAGADTTHLYYLRAEYPKGTSQDSNVIITSTTTMGPETIIRFR